MQNPYYLKTPQNVTAGLGSIRCLTDLVRQSGAVRVTLMTDPGILNSGTLDLALPHLEAAGAKVLVVGTIPPEPEDRQVLEIYRQVAEHDTQLLVAIGGGSVMDTTKMVAVLLRNPDYASNLTDQSKIIHPGVPSIMVPTSAGTGSEATPNSIVVIPEKKLKVGVVHPLFLPTTVILDPQMTKSLPPAVTAATGLDAFCHAIETFISKKGNPLCSLFALEGIRLVSANLRRAYHDGNDLEAREQMLLAAFYGGVAISSSSTVAVHALSYPLGGSYRIAHGISNAILLPLVMEYNMDAIPDKVLPIAAAMGIDTTGLSIAEAGDAVVAAIYQLCRDVGIPDSLVPFGISEQDIEFLTDSASEVRRLLDQNPKEMSKEDIRAIYRKLL